MTRLDYAEAALAIVLCGGGLGWHFGSPGLGLGIAGALLYLGHVIGAVTR